MRLRNLKIHRFGGLKGMEIGELSPGLNLVLGPNEAGKTTILEAVRCALFGFLASDHPRNTYQTLGQNRRVEMDLLTDESRILHLERRESQGKNHTSLTDAEGHDVPSEELLRLTHNLDRNVFEKLFAFSLEELQGLETLGSNGVRDRVLGAALGSVAVSPQGALDALLNQAGTERGEVARAQERLRDAREVVARTEGKVQERVTQEAELAKIENQLEELWEKEKELIHREADLRRRLDLWELGQELITKRRQLARTEVGDPLPADPIALLEELSRERDESRESIAALESRAAELETEMRLLAANEEANGQGVPFSELVRGGDLYERRLKDHRLAERELAHLRRQLDLLLEELGEGWNEASVRERMLPREQIHSMESHFEEIDHLQRALGLERVRLREDLAAEAPPDYRVRPILAGFGLFLAFFGLLGFFAGPQAGLVTSTVAVVLIAGLFFLASRFRAPKGAASQDSALLLDEVERALRGDADPMGRSPLVRQLAKKSAELETSMARSGFAAHLRPRDVRDMTRRLEEAVRALDRRDELVRQAETLEEQMTEQERLAGEVARHWGVPEPKRGEISRLLAVVDERQLEVTALRGRRHEIEGRLAGARETLRANRQRLGLIEARLAELHRAAGTSSAEELRDRVRRKAEWQQQAAEVERLEIAFQAKAGAADSRIVLAELERQTREEVEAEAEAVHQGRQDLKGEMEGLLKRRGVLEEVLRNEGEQAAWEEVNAAAESTRQELAHAIEKWASVRLAVELVTSAREQLERESQGPVLEKASELFAKITSGRYQRILSPLGTGQLELERWDGSRITEFKILSRGTREELYLAVRLAFLSHFCKEEGPLPVMMDDVLVNFDPGRARRAAQVIADLEEDTQILFFTCHPHVADSFRDLTDPRLVELPLPEAPPRS